MFHCATIMFMILEIAVVISLPDTSVNGEQISRITQRWINPTQWPTHDVIHPDLRARGNMGDMTRPPKKRGGKSMRFTAMTKKKTKLRRKRTSVTYDSVHHPCHYLALSCYRAYQTGRICGRGNYGVYMTFKNYCMLDYINCISGYQTWQAVHMGECLELRVLSTELHMSEESSKLMDEIYVPEMEA